MAQWIEGPGLLMGAADCVPIVHVARRELRSLEEAGHPNCLAAQSWRLLIEQAARGVMADAITGGPEISSARPEIGSSSVCGSDGFVDAELAAQRLGFKDGRRVRQLRDEGRLVGREVGRKVMISEASIEAELRRRGR